MDHLPVDAGPIRCRRPAGQGPRRVPVRPPEGKRGRSRSCGATAFAVAVMQTLGLWLFPAGLTDRARDACYVAPTRVDLLVQRRWVR